MRPDFYRGRRVLVTGADGFIDTYLCRRLEADGAQLFAMRRAQHGDLSEAGVAERVMGDFRPEVVFHLASLVTSGQSLDLVVPVTVAGLVAAVRLLAAAAAQRTPRVVLAGSMREPEGDEPPLSVYGAAKGAQSAFANCVVPRAILERIRARFGSYCDSIAPDSCFWFRFSALEERSLHFDRSLTILHHAQAGHGYHYQHGDVAYFRKPFGDVPWLTAAPIPGLDLGLNALYHEYELVRRETGDSLPLIDVRGYLRDLASKQRVRLRLVRLAADHFGRTPRDLSGSEFRSGAEALRYAMKHPRPFVAGSDYLSAVEPELCTPA